MHRCLKQHVFPDPTLMQRAPLRVLEVGSGEYKAGSYRDLFHRFSCEYVGVDIAAAPGVDVVLDDPYVLPFPDRSFDVVLSGQTFEHNPQFWRTLNEMSRETRQPAG